MIKCVIHCSDIHIRNFQRLNEYADQLTKFVEKCKEIAANYEREEVRIVISGDLVHQKNNISNELMTFSSFFLRELEQIAKVIVIAGNHDLLVNNTSRTDTLTALFETANFTDCVFIDSILNFESGFVEDDNIVWVLYSIYNGYAQPDMSAIDREDKKVIGLYHGMVVGATLNNGSVVDSGVDGDLFDGCDCVMAGDIHKRQVIKRGNVDIVYPGSLIQQTFGETVSQHGFVVWNIENMSYEFVDLETDYGLYDMEIESMDDIDNDKEKLINF
jgi:DNA repair exonuclease SbcCD nuclease subunit